MHAIGDFTWDGTSLVAKLGTNVNMIQRVSAGIYDLTFSSMGFDGYYVAASPSNSLVGGFALMFAITQQTATSCRVEFYRRSDGTYDDPSRFRFLALDTIP